MKPKKKFKNKILKLIAIIMLFFGLLASISVVWQTVILVEGVENNGLDSYMRLQEHLLSQDLIRVSGLAKEIAMSKEVSSYVATGSRSSRDAMMLYFGHSNMSNEYEAIYITNDKGIVLASTKKSFENQDYSFRDYFKHSIKGVSYQDSAIGVTSNLLGLYFSEPVRNKNQEVIGVLVIKAMPQLLTHNLTDIGGSNSYRASPMILDRYGVVLYAEKKDRQYKSLFTLSPAEMKEITDSKRFPKLTIQSVGYEESRDVVHSVNSNPYSYKFSDKTDGEVELVSTVKIGRYPYYLVAEIGYDEFIYTAIRTATILSLVMLVTVFSAFLFISLIMDRFLRPVEELAEVSDKIRSGNFEVRSNIKTGDEFETLSDNLSGMAHELGNKYQEMTKKIEEQTRSLNAKIEELKKINHLMVGREIKMKDLKKQIKKDQDEA